MARMAQDSGRGPEHLVTLVAADGDSAAFRCGPGSTIDEAARAAGCRLPVVCRNAGCGACRATLVSGDIRYLSPPSATKIRDPVTGERRYELLCRAIPLSDVVVRPEGGWTRRARHSWSAMNPGEED